MRKIFKLLKLLIIITLLMYVYHSYMLRKEAKLLKNKNNLMVNVNNHDMSIYIGGNSQSKYSLVFMSGSMIASPILEYKSLYSQFEKDYQVIVIEKAGYGYSEDSDASRDIDTILEEYRETLKRAGILNDNFILVPHSMSGIEALYWANKYPNEVKAIIGLDPTVPEFYQKAKSNGVLMDIGKMGAKVGFTRIPFVVNNLSAIKNGTLTSEEKQTYKRLFYKQILSQAMINESKSIKENTQKLVEIDKTQVPMLFFISNGKKTGAKESNWQNYLIDYVKSKENSNYYVLDCSHHMHNIEYLTIYEKSRNFIDSLI